LRFFFFFFFSFFLFLRSSFFCCFSLSVTASTWYSSSESPLCSFFSIPSNVLIVFSFSIKFIFWNFLICGVFISKFIFASPFASSFCSSSSLSVSISLKNSSSSSSPPSCLFNFLRLRWFASFSAFSSSLCIFLRFLDFFSLSFLRFFFFFFFSFFLFLRSSFFCCFSLSATASTWYSSSESPLCSFFSLRLSLLMSASGTSTSSSICIASPFKGHNADKSASLGNSCASFIKLTICSISLVLNSRGIRHQHVPKYLFGQRNPNFFNKSSKHSLSICENDSNSTGTMAISSNKAEVDTSSTCNISSYKPLNVSLNHTNEHLFATPFASSWQALKIQWKIIFLRCAIFKSFGLMRFFDTTSVSRLFFLRACFGRVCNPKVRKRWLICATERVIFNSLSKKSANICATLLCCEYVPK